MNTPCCVCAILIAGRKPQFMKCVSCHHFYHRQCSATSISSVEYVRKKKANEEFNARCVNCVGGVISFAAVIAVVDPPKRTRGRPVSYQIFVAYCITLLHNGFGVVVIVPASQPLRPYSNPDISILLRVTLGPSKDGYKSSSFARGNLSVCKIFFSFIVVC